MDRKGLKLRIMQSYQPAQSLLLQKIAFRFLQTGESIASAKTCVNANKVLQKAEGSSRASSRGMQFHAEHVTSLATINQNFKLFFLSNQNNITDE